MFMSMNKKKTHKGVADDKYILYRVASETRFMLMNKKTHKGVANDKYILYRVASEAPIPNFMPWCPKVLNQGQGSDLQSTGCYWTCQ
jgi:hypothetical protein